ncbi:MAG TPA: hypothetical protein VF284_06500, partial [Rhodanobacteraceae bacterium]
MLRKAVFPIAIALALCGCKANAMHDSSAPAREAAPIAAAPAETPRADPVNSTPSVANLDGTEWRFVEVEGQPVPSTVT